MNPANRSGADALADNAEIGQPERRQRRYSANVVGEGDSVLSRREVLLTVGLSVVPGGMTIAPAQAQTSTETEWVAALNEKIAALETQADELHLPPALPTVTAPIVDLNSNNAYDIGMRRLLQLVDRAGIQSEIGATASALLSELNLRQHVIPDLFNYTTRAPRPVFSSVKNSYRQMFKNCQIIPEKRELVDWHLGRIMKGESEYKDVSRMTKIPWYFIAIIHGLEASFNFNSHLHNGDPLSDKTVHVPKGRPEQWLPPSDWSSSAVDAMKFEGFSALNTWSVAEMLYYWESFNGFGYRYVKPEPIKSPYLWSFSNLYTTGKFESDRKYDPSLV